MSKALLITTTDLKKYSILNGNIDNDKFIQYIAISQDIHLQNYTGTNLLTKIQSLLPTDIDLAGNSDYKYILETYLKPMLIHWSLVEYLPFAAYQISNGGVFKHNSENSVTVDKNEIDYLVEKERNIAEHYTRRFRDYMLFNTAKFPEYLNNYNEKIQPDYKADMGGWVL